MADTTQKYRELRRKDPLLPACYALSQAKVASARDKWEGDGNDFTREVEGFTVKLHVEEESIYPVPDRNGSTDYGSYVDEDSRGYAYDWQGNWPQPLEFASFRLAEDTPSGKRVRSINFPYTAIRYHGPGWMPGEEDGYFIPDGIEEQFDYYRRSGQSRQAAWDLTRQWVEEQLEMLFSSPLTNCVVIVKAYKEDIELGSTAMGTDVSGDTDGWNYVFDMVEEHALIEDVIEEARENIDKLTECKSSAAS